MIDGEMAQSWNISNSILQLIVSWNICSKYLFSELKTKLDSLFSFYPDTHILSGHTSERPLWLSWPRLHSSKSRLHPWLLLVVTCIFRQLQSTEKNITHKENLLSYKLLFLCFANFLLENLSQRSGNSIWVMAVNVSLGLAKNHCPWT